ncbi:MAG: hypothetical protein LAO07_08390 [Acidobacteriia bacterium]|nr:hypothetical protein [Terriglobia bacterium]
MRRYLVTVLLLSVCHPGLAQQPACTVPATVVAPDLSPAQKASLDAMDWQPPLPSLKYQWLDFITPLLESVPVTNLSADAFVARDKKGPIRVLSATYDRGPRRVILVAENGKKMPAAARKIEAAVISDVLSKARTEDSFALLTARGPRVDLHFGSSREAIRAAAEQLENPPRGKPGKGGVLDAVLEATTWFQPPRAGDSIFVLALHAESKHRASFSEVRATLAVGHIRVFACELGQISQPNPEDLQHTSFDGGYSSTTYIPVGNVDHLVALSNGSGGLTVGEDTEKRNYTLSDGRLKRLQYEAEIMYKAVTEHYLVGLDSASPNLSIRLASSVLSGTPWATVSYPTYLPPCSNTPGMGPGPQPPCLVPVNVTVPDLTSLPIAAADTLAAEWKQNIQTQKYELADGSWDQREASWEFWKSLNRATQPKMALVDDLSAGDFVVRDKKRLLQVQSVTSAHGPQRIIIVAENGQELPAAARKTEVAVVSHIHSKARAEDSFALLTAEGPRVELRFGSSRDAIRAAAEQLGNPPQGKSGSPGALAAVLEATTWLQPPQPGDSIFVMSRGFESGLTVTFSKVRAALAAGHIRVFGVQFGWYDYAATQLFNDSGGWVADGTPPRASQSGLTDDQLRELESDAEEMYTEATEHYLLQLDSFGPQLKIDLASPTLNRFPWAHVRYPHHLPACANPATKPPAEARPRK